MIVGAMVGQWGTISRVQNRGGGQTIKPSAKYCDDCRKQSYFIQFLNTDAWGLCD